MSQMLTISSRKEECICDGCEAPLYVGDSCHVGEDGMVFCSKVCESEYSAYNSPDGGLMSLDDYWKYVE